MFANCSRCGKTSMSFTWSMIQLPPARIPRREDDFVLFITPLCICSLWLLPERATHHRHIAKTDSSTRFVPKSRQIDSTPPQLADFEHDGGDVISLRRVAGEGADGFVESLHDFGRRPMAIGTDNVEEAIEAEDGVVGRHCFFDSIGDEEN